MKRQLACQCDPSMVVIRGRRYQRLNHDGLPEPDPARGTGFCLHPDDRPVHGKRAKRGKR